MTHNDIFRRLRYIFSLSDSKVISFYDMGNFEVSRAEISSWLKKEDQEGYEKIRDKMLAVFLNGLIIEKRGKQDGAYPEPENRLNNNIIFRKLKIALTMQDDAILSVMVLGGMPISKHELSAFFRKSDHKNYRGCNDQVLRYFLKGLQFHIVDEKPLVEAPAVKAKPTENKEGFAWSIPKK